MSNIYKTLNDLAIKSAIFFVGSIFGRGIGLLGYIMIVRSLSPEIFGLLGLTLTITSIIAGLAIIGIPNALPRLMAANRQDQARFFSTSFQLTFLSGSLFALIVVLFRSQVSHIMGDPRLSSLLPVFAAYVILHSLSKVTIASLRGLKQSTRAILIRDIEAKTIAIFIFSIFLIYEMPFLGAIFYWLSIPSIIIVFGLYTLQSTIPISTLFELKWDKKNLSTIGRFSGPLALETGFILLMTNLDVLMIGVLSSTTNVGLYKAIQPIPPLIIILLNSVVFVFLPIATEYFEEGKIGELNGLYKFTTKWIVTFTTPLVLTFAVFNEEMIMVIFTREYMPASSAFLILSLGMFIRIVVGPNGAMVKAINKPKIEFYSSSVGLIANVILNVFLIPLFGITGAAIATASGFTIYNSIELILLYSNTDSNPFSINMIKPYLISIPSIIIFHQYIQNYKIDLLLIFFIGLAFTAIHISSVILTNSIDDADKKFFSEVRSEL